MLLLHIGHSKPMEPCRLSQPPGDLPGGLAQAKDREGSAVAATKPTLFLMNPDETASPALPAPFPSFLN